MRRVVVLVTLLTLIGAACSDKNNEAQKDVDDGNLVTIETAVEEGSAGIEKGDRLVDAAVATDGVLILALRDAQGHHRLLSLREGRAPRELANEETVPGFAPTAVAVDSRFRIVYAASGDQVLKFEDNHGSEGGEQEVAKRGPAEPGHTGSYGLTVEIGVPRYMTFDDRTNNLYIADLCRVARFHIRGYGAADVARVAGSPGSDCAGDPARVTGLAVDQRTGDVYVGSGDNLRRVGADGKLMNVEASVPDRLRPDEKSAPKAVTGLGHDGASLAVNAIGDVLVVTSGGVLQVRADGTLDKISGVEESKTLTHSGRPDTALKTYGDDWIGLDGAGNLYIATRQHLDGRPDSPIRIRKVIAAAL
jgi:hypothetical protein